MLGGFRGVAQCQSSGLLSHFDVYAKSCPDLSSYVFSNRCSNLHVPASVTFRLNLTIHVTPEVTPRRSLKKCKRVGDLVCYTRRLIPLLAPSIDGTTHQKSGQHPTLARQ